MFTCDLTVELSRRTGTHLSDVLMPDGHVVCALDMDNTIHYLSKGGICLPRRPVGALAPAKCLPQEGSWKIAHKSKGRSWPVAPQRLPAPSQGLLAGFLAVFSFGRGRVA